MSSREENIISLPILLNSTHYVPGTDSTYRYTFPAGGITLKHGDTCSLAQISMYYSWFNISASQYANNTLAIVFGATTINITIPDGSYSVADIQNYIEYVCRQNNLYVLNDKQQPVYFVNIQTNANRYRVQIDCLLIPVTLPTGWTYPTGVTSIPGAGNTPQVVLTNTAFGKLIGFSVGTYPAAPSTADISSIGTLVPQIHPVQSIIVRSNIVSNGKYSNPADMIANFAASNSVKPGESVEYEPNDYSYISVRPGKYDVIEISFTDQLLAPLKLQDTDLTILILLKIID